MADSKDDKQDEAKDASTKDEAKADSKTEGSKDDKAESKDTKDDKAESKDTKDDKAESKDDKAESKDEAKSDADEAGEPVGAGAHDDHGHHGPAYLAHHFDSMDQQDNAGKFGMWLFLSTEVLLFAGLFCAYAVYRANHPEVFEYASQFLDVKWGAINTVVLLLSSFTVAMAVRQSQLGKTKEVTVYLALTLVGALGFLAIKSVEYTHKFHEHLVWGTSYAAQTAEEVEYDPERAPKHEDEHADAGEGEHEGEEAQLAQAPTVQQPEPTDLFVDHPLVGQGTINPEPALGPAGLRAEAKPAETGSGEVLTTQKLRNVHIFFGIYFVMTGTHGLHVLIGMGAIIWVMIRNIRGDFNEEYNLPIDLVGLYWHIVDLIWIYLFPLLYLIG